MPVVVVDAKVVPVVQAAAVAVVVKNDELNNQSKAPQKIYYAKLYFVQLHKLQLHVNSTKYYLLFCSKKVFI